MIYNYKLQYDAGGNVNGYLYTISTGSNSSISFQLRADGTTNDTPELQGLLDEIDNQGGGTLVLPSDTEIAIKRHIIYDENNDPTYQSYGISLPSNITIKSSGGKCTLKADFTLGSSFYWMVLVRDRTNVFIEDICFLGNGLTSNAIYFDNGSDMTVSNCEFSDINALPRTLSNGTEVDQTAVSVNASNIDTLRIESCTFRNGEIGINIEDANTDVYIENNVFEPSLSNNPIRVYPGSVNNLCTDGLWITGNDIKIRRAAEIYLDNPALGIQRYSDGRVIWTNQYTTVVPKPIGNSAINITGGPTTHHQNVVVADNIATGPDYGFYDGGSGDLFSLKDVIRLKCYGNTARNSGDLGFAIERCHFGVVSNNTADRNNSCGISVFESTHMSITGNVCSDNELSRDGAYLGNPYGGIRVERSSVGISVDGNYCYANSGVKRSFVNGLATATQGPDTFYNQTGSPTQRYGVVVKNVWNEIPHNVKVGNNHTSGLLWGSDYSNVKASQMLNTFTASSAPTEGDYPLGTRMRNNLLLSSTATINEWQVVNHIRMKLVASTNTTTGLDKIKVQTLNSNSSFVNSLIENNDFTTILVDDIIGIAMDNYDVHWAKVVSVASLGGTPEVADIRFTPALPDAASYTVTNVTVGTGNVDVIDTKDVVCLRWEEVK